MHTAGMQSNHIHFMRIAIEQARLAGQMGEVPIGAVLVDRDGEILATGKNQTISNLDPSAHAEMIALRQGARKTRNYRLLSTTLYVTIEPCVMCMGALIHARVAYIVYGAPDPKWGAAGSMYDFASDSRFNHHPNVIGGICEGECRQLIQSFFKEKRH
jgi:tRNA(adenine34) deaminase